MGALLSLGLSAQPGWIPLRFTFVLEKDGVEVPNAAMREGGTYSIEVEGRSAPVFSDADPRFTRVSFPAERSDPMRHVDTLWMRIRHSEEGVMAIGFPPRGGRGHARYYPTDHLVVPFTPGRILVTELMRELRVVGTMEGLGQWWSGGRTFILDATCGGDTLRNVAAPMGRRTDFRVRCPVRSDDKDPANADLHFISDGPYQPDLHMHVSGPVADPGWDLGTIVFGPYRYRLANQGRVVMDEAAPGDTVFGWHELGNVVYLSHAHPTAQDSLRFRFWWLGGREEVRITHRIAPTFEGEQVLVFTVECLADELAMGSGFTEREVEVVVPPLQPMRYTMALEYVDVGERAALRFDGLTGRPLEVRW